MKKTANHYYNMPDREDKVLVGDLNQNAEMIDRDIEGLNIDLSTKAPIDSPKFIGEPMAPKPGVNNNKIIYERIATVSNISDALEVEKL